MNEKKIITITLVKNKFPSISSIEATWYIISPWAWIQFDSFLFIIIHNIIRFILLILTYETRKNINMNKELILSKDNMGIGDWGLGIGDWGLGIGPNPQSPIPNFEHYYSQTIVLK